MQIYTHRMRTVIVHLLEVSTLQRFLPLLPPYSHYASIALLHLVPSQSPHVVGSVAIQLVPISSSQWQVLGLRGYSPAFVEGFHISFVRIVGKRVLAYLLVMSVMVSTAIGKTSGNLLMDIVEASLI